MNADPPPVPPPHDGGLPAIPSALESRPAEPTVDGGRIRAGIAWNSLFGALSAALSFGTMVVITRLVGPSEQGMAAAATAPVGMIGLFGASLFTSHALQRENGLRPDWRRVLRCALRANLLAAAACNGLAFGCRFVPWIAPAAGLMHLASLGFLADAPTQVIVASLRYEMNFLALRWVALLAQAWVFAVVAAGAACGLGAAAIVLGNNVLAGLPFLFLWRRIGGARDRAATIWPEGIWPFAKQHLAASVPALLRSQIESVLLTAQLGFEAVGLLSRANGLISATAGRLQQAVTEALVPALNLVRGEERFARLGRAYIGGATAAGCFSAVFFLRHGQLTVTALLGPKWTAAGAVMAPAALAGCALCIFSAAQSTIVAACRYGAAARWALLHNGALLACLGAILAVKQVEPYAWTLALASIAVAAWSAASALRLAGGSFLEEFLPPVAAGCCGLLAAEAALRALGLEHGAPLRFAVAASAYGIFGFAAMWGFFPRWLGRLVAYLPRGARFAASLGIAT